MTRIMYVFLKIELRLFKNLLHFLTPALIRSSLSIFLITGTKWSPTPPKLEGEKQPREENKPINMRKFEPEGHS